MGHVRGSILVVEDEKPLRENLLSLLKSLGYTVSGVGSVGEGVERLKEQKFELIVTDIKLPGGSGLELIEHVQKHSPEIMVVVITGYGTLDTAVQAMRMGAQDYIQKPFDFDLLRLTVERVLEKVELRHRIEEEHQKVLEYARDLEKANEDLKESQGAVIARERAEAIAQLAGATAHELNQPLMTILGAAEILRKELPQESPSRARIEAIIGQAERMAELVRKIGRLTHFQTRPYAGGKEILDIREPSTS